MDKYRQYKVEDFLNDPLFRQWMNKPNAEVDGQWKGFLQRYPEKKRAIHTARAMYKALEDLEEEPTTTQSEAMWEIIRGKTQPEPTAAKKETPIFIMARWKRYVAAASVCLVVGWLGWTLYSRFPNGPAETYADQVADARVPLTEQTNPDAQPREIVLPDGSVVTLYPSAKLSYEESFSGTGRTVYLTGKAHFEVVSDSTKPFRVFSNELVTQVVGTSFIIDSPSATEQTTVLVISGKVKVYKRISYEGSNRQGGETDMVFLTPNQQVAYDPNRKSLVKAAVSQPRLLTRPRDYPDFYFENTDVVNVFRTLSESYGVTIRYDAKTIQDCIVTAPLGDEPLFRKLDIICQTIGATYEVWGTEIVVSGPGCGN